MRDGSPYLMIDMPTFVWDPKIMTAGDVVEVKITIVGEDGGGTRLKTLGGIGR